MIDRTHLKNVIEAALLAAGQPLSLDQLMDLFEEHERPDRGALREAVKALAEDYAGRGIELAEVASGFRIQVRADFASAISRLWHERPPRYSRALLETLALIAYRQPITRGEIEEIRGVSVSTNIMRSLLERNWIRIVGHRDVPGRPGMYGTTREFLDCFGLKSLDELPPLAELRDLDRLDPELELLGPGEAPPWPEADSEKQERDGPNLRIVSGWETAGTRRRDAGPDDGPLVKPTGEVLEEDCPGEPGSEETGVHGGGRSS